MLLTPAERHELADLKAAGFTGYLVKPVRVASLAARFTATETADAGMADEVVAKTADTPSAGLTVLVAEDNEINALLARALVASAWSQSDRRGEWCCGGRCIHCGCQRRARLTISF